MRARRTPGQDVASVLIWARRAVSAHHSCMRIQELRRALMSMGEDDRGPAPVLQARYDRACASARAAANVAQQRLVTFDSILSRGPCQDLKDAATVAACSSAGNTSSLHLTFEHMALQNTGHRVITSAASNPSVLDQPRSEAKSAFVWDERHAAVPSCDGRRGQPWETEAAGHHPGSAFLVSHLVVDDGRSIETGADDTSITLVPARRLRWGGPVTQDAPRASRPLPCQWLHGESGRRPVVTPPAPPGAQHMGERHRVGNADHRFNYMGAERGEWRPYGPLDNHRAARAAHQPSYSELQRRAADGQGAQSPRLDGKVALTFGSGPAAHADALEAERRGAAALVHLRSPGHSVSRSGVGEADPSGEEELTPLHSCLALVVVEVRGRTALRLHECVCRAPHLLRFTISCSHAKSQPLQRQVMAHVAAEAAARPEPRELAESSASPFARRLPPMLPEGVSNWLVAVPIPEEPVARPATNRLENPPAIFADGRRPLPKSYPLSKRVWFNDGDWANIRLCDPVEAKRRALEQKMAQWEAHAAS